MIQDRAASCVAEHSLPKELCHRIHSRFTHFGVFKYFRSCNGGKLNLRLKQRRKPLLIHSSIRPDDLILVHLEQEIPDVIPLCNTQNTLVRMCVHIGDQLIQREDRFFCTLVSENDRHTESYRQTIDLPVLLRHIFQDGFQIGLL